MTRPRQEATTPPRRSWRCSRRRRHRCRPRKSSSLRCGHAFFAAPLAHQTQPVVKTGFRQALDRHARRRDIRRARHADTTGCFFAGRRLGHGAGVGGDSVLGGAAAPRHGQVRTRCNTRSPVYALCLHLSAAAAVYTLKHWVTFVLLACVLIWAVGSSSARRASACWTSARAPCPSTSSSSCTARPPSRASHASRSRSAWRWRSFIPRSSRWADRLQR